MLNNIGIILRTNSSRNNKVTIFDRESGKLELFVSGSSGLNYNINLSNGMLVNYVMQNNRNLLMQHINILDVPVFMAQNNILFFHHVLELCYYFIPMGGASSELFDLIYYLFFSFDKFEDLKSQRIFLGRFFLLSGNYSEDIFNEPHIYKLLSNPINNDINQIPDSKSDSHNEKKLQAWIIKCVNMHPYAKSFKTIKFLNSIAIT